MNEEQKIYVDDTGVEINLNCIIDVSVASTVSYKVQKPDGTEVEWSATKRLGYHTYLTYTTSAGDLDQVGIYHIQPYVEFGGPTSAHRGDTYDLKVYALWK
jgi:hypothetical protein